MQLFRKGGSAERGRAVSPNELGEEWEVTSEKRRTGYLVILWNGSHPHPIPRREPPMPLLHITPGQVDVQLSRTLGRVSQDLLKDGGGASRLYPERSCGVAEEVGGEAGSIIGDDPDTCPRFRGIFVDLRRSARYNTRC
jgi:hypothetical protein